MTLIELVLVLGILALAFGMLSSTLMANSRQRSVNRESAAAAEAARGVFEDMMNVDFEDVFATYNADPADDPGGAGTAPGDRFDVIGLSALEASPDGMEGQVVLPALTFLPDEWELREDFVDEDLGMPRDLNGDSIIDDLDHADDYLILPVRVELEWMGRFGPRRMSVSVILADVRKAGP
jgi:hypothetical protein